MNSETDKIDEIERLVWGFENCTLQPSMFHHRDHLAVTLWYQIQDPDSDPVERFRASLHKFADHYQLKAYNETITIFWVRIVNRHFKQCVNEQSFPALLESLIERYGDSQFIFNYFSKAHLMSDEAKSQWVDPDLKPLDF